MWFPLCLGICLISFCLNAEGRLLTFEEALQRAQATSPALAIAADAVGAKEGLRFQSGLLPNPIMGYSVENVWGNKNWQGWKSAENRYELAQVVELGGKRGYRSNVAQYQLSASEANYQTAQLVLLNRLCKAFAEVAALQEHARLAGDQQRIAQEVFNAVSGKVEAGKVSLIQQNKADIALSTAVIDRERVQAGLASSREKLALLWGAQCVDFEWVDYPFYAIEPAQELSACLTDLSIHPDLLRAQFEALSAQQALFYEKAGAIPDLIVTIGYKTVQDTHNQGMIVGATLPLPIIDRNQGNVQRARYDVQKMEDEWGQLQLLLQNKVSVAQKEMTQAFQEVMRLKSTMLAAAERSFGFAQEGYKEGKFEYLDMLDSQKTLFEVRARYIQALLNYHRSKADLTYPILERL